VPAWPTAIERAHHRLLRARVTGLYWARPTVLYGRVQQFLLVRYVHEIAIQSEKVSASTLSVLAGQDIRSTAAVKVFVREKSSNPFTLFPFFHRKRIADAYVPSAMPGHTREFASSRFGRFIPDLNQENATCQQPTAVTVEFVPQNGRPEREGSLHPKALQLLWIDWHLGLWQSLRPSPVKDTARQPEAAGGT